MKVAYCRQSSKEQALNTNALHQQIDRCKKTGVDKVYSDIASGKKKNRKQFNQLLKDAGKGQITEVVCTRVDRLGRSVLAIQSCLDILVKHSIKLTVLDGDCDIDTASGRGVIAIQAAVAQMEAELIAERIKNGKEYARQQGYALNPPFGYTIVDREYQLHPEYSKIARGIIDKFLELRSLNATAKFVVTLFPKPTTKKGGATTKDCPPLTATGIKNWITHPVLRGYTRYKTPEIQILPTHLDQVLLLESEWAEIQSIINYNKNHHGYKKQTKTYPLSGLLRCVCGKSLSARHYGRYYACSSHLCNRKKLIKSVFVETELIKSLVVRSVDILRNLEKCSKEFREDPRLKELRKQLTGLEQLGNNIAIEAARESIKSQIAILEQEAATKDYSEESIQKLTVFQRSDYWLSLSTSDKTTIYRDLVEKIVVNDKEIAEIVLRL